MRLSALFQGVSFRGSLPPGAEAVYITDDSRNVKPGSVFVCIAGKHFDGHSKAAEAVAAGAVCVVAERPTGAQPELLVENSREAYALLCAAFFGHPAKRLILVGVTGTNGKTTTACLLKDIFDRAGCKTGLVGTLHNRIGDEELPAELTTPDPWELQGLFAKMVKQGCTHCFMEVSSQALDQRRVAGVQFRAGIFTNLTQEHLDYHGSFEAYREAKQALFQQCALAVTNMDDEAGPGMPQGSGAAVVTYSLRSNGADYTAKNIVLRADGVAYELVGRSIIGRVRFGVPGAFSVYNSLAAACTALELGLPLQTVLEAIEQSPGVKGRMEVVPTGAPYPILIDYAHTPDGLENVLRALKETTAGRIITVFGCGGDRDKTKRPLMGRIAAERSDIAVVTSDNPRSEDPDAIIADILAGMPKNRAQILVQPDRRLAIALALKKAKEGDVVLLAGKGQETYQILATGKIHMDEREIVRECLG
ncbi:MAG: UDP-N-acetylmuramoyl-L-alanyl-D-glutamate--2,6-diaminopimelate ligase [Oscillospiraceae bacterium]|jgi:UDP-N-acetylmuramoyl-L-alanyl-D-glutamate--2,6-diaminopimelate ligase|nr:UDP-N-acetylmuramoyl-L-alanyl-D-glutamate--2,6-diaminopimelate ligase [Oscillospiraceae bacterium]